MLGFLSPVTHLVGHFERGDDGLDGGDLALVEEDEGVLVLDLDGIINRDKSSMIMQLEAKGRTLAPLAVLMK